MSAGLLGAVGAALAYGLATALQALGAKRAAARSSSALLHPMTIAGTVLDGAGVLLAIVALRSLPLYAVQAVISGNLAVAAVAARLLLGQRLGRRHALAVVVVTAGLALVGASAGADTAVAAPGWLVALLVAVAAATATVVGGDTLRPRAGGVVLGLVAGCGFAAYAVAVRALPDLAVGTLLGSPAAWAGAVAGGAAFLAMLRGLQRAAVATVTGPIVVLETVLPALAGVVALGDRPAAPAVAGMVLAVIGAVVLADTRLRT